MNYRDATSQLYRLSALPVLLAGSALLVCVCVAELRFGQAPAPRRQPRCWHLSVLPKTQPAPVSLCAREDVPVWGTPSLRNLSTFINWKQPVEI